MKCNQTVCGEFLIGSWGDLKHTHTHTHRDALQSVSAMCTVCQGSSVLDFGTTICVRDAYLAAFTRLFKGIYFTTRRVKTPGCVATVYAVV